MLKKVRETEQPSLLSSRFDQLDTESILPNVLRAKLFDLFSQIEQEFEVIYAENLSLHEKLYQASEKQLCNNDNQTQIQQQILTGQNVTHSHPQGGANFNISSGIQEGLTCRGNRQHRTAMVSGGKEEALDGIDGNLQAFKQSVKKCSQISQRIKSTYKTSTNKIVSSFKNPSYTFSLVREFCGHRDGVWEVSINKLEPKLIATASADHTACVWLSGQGTCLAHYLGHMGSVNSIRFHPVQQDLVVTASGDKKTHLWRTQINSSSLENVCSSVANKNKNSSSEELEESMEKEEGSFLMSPDNEVNMIHQPTIELLGHTGAVVAADWLAGGGHVITASWDRTANMYDADNGALINTLTGHDQELTNVSAHPSQKLVMTSSKDMTFRLWDFREPSMKVNVFQGHTQSVSTAVFAGGDTLVSGSDDRTVKVWDLKNMRSPITTIRTDSSVNRLCISSVQNLIAVPLDNCHLHLFDLNGLKQGRMSKTGKGHSHMICSVAWNDDKDSATFGNLYTSGFDRRVYGWIVSPQIEK